MAQIPSLALTREKGKALRTKIQGGWFSDDPHLYTDEQGKFVPSLTQVLKLQGLSDYFGVDEAVMENAARRGTEVHSLAAMYNKYGDLDPSWITKETQPYFSAYMDFLEHSGFQPDSAWTELPMIATIHGFKLGVTADAHGKMGRANVVLELKTTSARQPSWSIQTCLQECAIYQTNRCGRAKRYALMLMADGKYRLGEEHTDHDTDLAVGIAALRCVYWRMESGQDLRKRLQV